MEENDILCSSKWIHKKRGVIHLASFRKVIEIFLNNEKGKINKLLGKMNSVKFGQNL